MPATIEYYAKTVRDSEFVTVKSKIENKLEKKKSLIHCSEGPYNLRLHPQPFLQIRVGFRSSKLILHYRLRLIVKVKVLRFWLNRELIGNHRRTFDSHKSPIQSIPQFKLWRHQCQSETVKEYSYQCCVATSTARLTISTAHNITKLYCNLAPVHDVDALKRTDLHRTIVPNIGDRAFPVAVKW